MMDQLQQPVLCRQLEGGVLEIRLNRPQKLNAITTALLAELAGLIERAAREDDIRAVLLAAEGRAFSVGQDLTERDPRRHAWPFDLDRIQREQFQPVIEAMEALPKPLVVAVNGVASGAGAGLALAGDLVVAAQSASFAFSFVRIGLSSDAGVAWNLVKTLGPARARAVLMLGESVSAVEAERIGLIGRCVPDETLTDVATDMARSLASGPTRALGLMKRAVQAATWQTRQEYLTTEAALQGDAGRTADYREGIMAFLEKRPPRFSGR